MLIAWNNGDPPLHKGVLPPFLYGKGVHNQWILTEALISDFRLVIDASSTMSSFSPDDLDGENFDFENSTGIIGNSLLGELYGSFSFREAKVSNLLKLFECNGDYILVNTDQNIAYPLNLRKKGILLPLRKKKILECLDVVKSLEGIKGCFVQKQVRLLESLLLPFSLESILSMQADQNKTVILGIAGYSYKDMLMSWVCRLRHLRVTNFLVCALDDDVHEFSILQVSHFPLSKSVSELSFKFGRTSCSWR